MLLEVVFLLIKNYLEFLLFTLFSGFFYECEILTCLPKQKLIDILVNFSKNQAALKLVSSL
jgi:hypothetical protein